LNNFQAYTVTTPAEYPRDLLRVCAGLLLSAVFSIAFASAAPQEIEVPAWFKHSFLDLRDDVKDAAGAKKRVMIYFGQNGCPYCKRLMDVNFRQKDIIDKTRAHFDVIELNILGNREVTWMDGKTRSEKDLSALLKVQFTPTLLFLDEMGAIALRINGYYPPERFMTALDYVAQRNENKISFANFQQRGQRSGNAGALRDESFFRKPPFDFDRRKPAQRPLVIFFEQRTCADCDELHANALNNDLTRRLLSRFDVYQLDLHGSEPLIAPNGSRTTAQRWGNSLKVLYAPGVVFFDGHGREVFRVEAYMRAFHLQSALEYVSSGAYLKEPSFQRYVQARADTIREQGGRVDLMQ